MPESIRNLRYPGIRPFNPDEARLFFGRDQEIQDLLRLVRLNKTTLLYSKSGMGKSSLLRAGVMHALEESKEYEPFLIRFTAYHPDNAHALGPTDSVLQTALPSAPAEHPFKMMLPEADTMWTRLKKLQSQHPGRKYLLIFDQFEELFSYPASELAKFKYQLAELLFTKVPQEFRDHPALDGDDLSPDALEAFLTPTEVQVIFSIRFDRMGLLQQLTDQFPRILNNFYELLPLRREAAMQAIVEPAKASGDFASPLFTFHPDTLKKILDDLEGGTPGIEPSQVQIVCAYLEERVIQRKLREIPLSEVGDIRTILNKYYETMLGWIPNTRDRDLARRIIEDELIVGGARVTLPRPTLLSKGLSVNLIDTLVNNRLLRSELTSTGPGYEITHDSMVAPILVSREKRMKKKRDRRFMIALVIFMAALMSYLAWDEYDNQKKFKDFYAEAMEASRDQRWAAAVENLQIAKKYDSISGIEDSLTRYLEMEKFERSADSLVALGDSIFFMRDTTESQKDFKRILVYYQYAERLYPDQQGLGDKITTLKEIMVDDYYMRATVFVEAGSFEDACHWIEEALEISPEEAIHKRKKGDLCDEMTKAAEKANRKAGKLVINPPSCCHE